jgi:hypothetical protein
MLRSQYHAFSPEAGTKTNAKKNNDNAASTIVATRLFGLVVFVVVVFELLELGLFLPLVPPAFGGRPRFLVAAILFSFLF